MEGMQDLAVCACLAVSVSLGLSVIVPRLASRVTLAVRADARDAIYLSMQNQLSLVLLCVPCVPAWVCRCHMDPLYFPPRLASRVTSAVRANARDVAFICSSIYAGPRMGYTPIPGLHWLSGLGMVVSTCLERDRERVYHTLPNRADAGTARVYPGRSRKIDR